MTTKPRTAEEWVLELASQLAAQPHPGPDELGDPLPSDQPGVIASFGRWGEQHPDASHDLTVAAMSAPGLIGSDVGQMLLGLGDLFEALGTLEAGDVDALLKLRPPRVALVGGTMRFAVMTPFSDRDALIHEVLGATTSRPKYRKANPTFPASIRGAGNSDEVRELLGVGPAVVSDALDPKRPDDGARRKMAAKLVEGVRQMDPAIGEAMATLGGKHVDALFETPLMRHLVARLNEVRPPSRELEAQFVQVIEMPPVGWIALVAYDSSLGATRSERNEIAAHLRYVADFVVAPWNRFPSPRDRKAALYLFYRRLAGVPLDIDGLAKGLRDNHREEYADETAEHTMGRLYRISGSLRDARPPRRTQQYAREQATAQGLRVSRKRRFKPRGTGS